MTKHKLPTLITLNRKKIKLSERARKKNQGSNWIWRGTRKTIYHCAGGKCVWCGKGTETAGLVLSLDHIIPNAYGGSNKKENLLVACVDCNTDRKDTFVIQYIRILKSRGASENEIKAIWDRIAHSYNAHTNKSVWKAYQQSAKDSGILVKTKKGWV